ncbi:hypothetical protein AVEN_66599-1 [Araneus ventricosus]|uniref:Uncharacterized protein n=1 Tax=Araneus ventricosus TaxID=182803 RepID=A0A4Y2M299_ARAVE|nr:hypothetical protein AVEN_66599-1 [Araneus ventricosus]
MEQDRGCRPGDSISPLLGNECVLLCPLLCGILHYDPRTKPFEAYCHSCSLVIKVRSFSIHLHLFPALKSALSGRHFRSNGEVQLAVKNFFPSLGTDIYQNGLLKLISRYYKCMMTAVQNYEVRPEIALVLLQKRNVNITKLN